MDDDETCFGCKHTTSYRYDDGTTSYGCALTPGLVTGEDGPWSRTEDLPKRCGEYEG